MGLDRTCLLLIKILKIARHISADVQNTNRQSKDWIRSVLQIVIIITQRTQSEALQAICINVTLAEKNRFTEPTLKRR